MQDSGSSDASTLLHSVVLYIINIFVRQMLDLCININFKSFAISFIVLVVKYCGRRQISN